MAATMVDLANTSKDPLEAGVAEMFLQYSDIMKEVNYETIGDLRVAMSRVAVLPTVGYRAIGGAYTEGTARFEQLEEDLSVIGHDIDLDRELDGNKSQLVSLEQANIDASLKALSYRITNDFINGDRATLATGVDGMFVRVGNLPARQTFDGVAGADLAVFTSTATLNTFADAMDDAISRVDNSQVSFIIADEVSIRGIFSAYRRLGTGIVDYKTFALGGGEMSVRTVKLGTTVIPLLIAGFTDETQATRVMPSTEILGDGSADTASLLFVRMDKMHLTGLQKAGLRTKKFDELEARPAKRIRLDWVYGYSNWNDRSMVRLTGLRFAAA